MQANESGNLGNIDRAFRALGGLLLLGFCFVGHGALWALIGALPLVTGIAGECPLYRALGVSTRPGAVVGRKEAL